MSWKEGYFDYAATTPVAPEVMRAIRPYFDVEFGNPSNLYAPGHHARLAIDAARVVIGRVLNCASSDFVFTGSATESDNLALLGVARAHKSQGNKIIVSAVEHKGILVAADALRREGFEIVELGVGRDGMINPADFAAALDSRTVIVSITYADSELGVIQPINELARIMKDARGARPLPYFHTDATQAALFCDLDVERLGVDLMTLSAHKIYGPKGVGGLFIKKGVKLQPIIFGGGQQDRIRAGTENVAGIVGFAAALTLAAQNRVSETKRLCALRDELESGILARVPKVVVNGRRDARLPNFLNISILDIEGESLILFLDARGIYVNTGSACNSQSLDPSHILMALGMPYEYIHGSARFTLGKYTTAASVKRVIELLPAIVKRLREISPLKLTLNEPKDIAVPEAFIGGQTPHFLRKKLSLSHK